MTHDIPAWSANLSVNIPRDERDLLGRLATERGERSVGAFVKRLVLLGLDSEDAAGAAKVRAIRARYYAVVLLGIFSASLMNHEVLRRPIRRVRETEIVWDTVKRVPTT